MAAMLAALTFVATAVIKIPTPTTGYVHIGDCFVLLSGFVLGPVAGGLSAGLGSMLADLLGGYVVWAPGTFLIKFATAMIAAVIYRLLDKVSNKEGHHAFVKAVAAGAVGEAVMIIGYFFYNVVILTVVNTGAESVALSAAFMQSFAEIPFNVTQGVTGVVLSSVSLPVVARPSARQVTE